MVVYPVNGRFSIYLSMCKICGIYKFLHLKVIQEGEFRGGISLDKEHMSENMC